MSEQSPYNMPAGGAAGSGSDPAGLSPTRIGRVPPPLLLNRYQVIRLLGRGASGEVLEVRDLSTDISYAFKHVSPEVSKHSTQFQALQSNFALVSQLAHPHIATTRFFERDPQSGDVCLLMDLVRGKSMAEYIADYRTKRSDPEAPMPVPLALGIAEQIAAGLDYAHAQPSTWNPDGSPKRYGVLHRDLKPMNVMLESAREYRPGVPFVRLVDFGLAAEIQASLTSLSIATPQNNEICGTPGYMAPEQWEGRTLTRGVDQWALAVMIYEMVAGRPPFRAPSQMALMEQIRRAKAEKPATLTDTQWQALNKTFTVDRKNRYPSCLALVRAIAQADPLTATAVQVPEQRMPDEYTGAPATGTQPAVATGTQPAMAFPTTTTVIQAPSQSHAWLVAVGALLLLLLAAGSAGGYFWFQKTQGDAMRKVVNETTPALSSQDEKEVDAAVIRLEQAESEYPYAQDSARVMLLTTLERLRSRSARLADRKRSADEARASEAQRQAAYLEAFEKARRILESNDPDRLEDADLELSRALSLADSQEKNQQVLDLRKQIAQQIKERKDLMAVLFFTNGLEDDVKTEADRIVIARTLISRFRILPTERLLAAAMELKRGDLKHLSNDDLLKIVAKTGARGAFKLWISPGEKGGTEVTLAGELLNVERGVVQNAVLETKDLAEVVDRIPLMVRLLQMTDDEKEQFFAARRKREAERLAEQKRQEEERLRIEEEQKRLAAEKNQSDQDKQRLAEEKRRAEAAAEKERQQRLEQERRAKQEAARREAEKRAAEAAAAAEREKRLEQERAAQLAVDKARGTSTVRRVWVEHNQTSNNMKGMLIHADFTVQWRKDIPGHAVAFFYWKSGEKAVAPNDNGPYLAKDGQVAVWDEYKPQWDNTEWKDFKLFMPYYRFSAGEYKFNIQVRTNNFQTTLTQSEYLTFKISK